MTSFAELYKQAEEEGAISSELPNGGPYTAQITHANVSKTQKGAPRVGFRFRITEGPAQGESGWMNQVITPKSAGIAFQILGRLGITYQMMDQDAELAVQGAVGQMWTITVARKQNGQYTNVNVTLKERIESAGAPAPAAPTPEPAAQAVPSSPASPAPVSGDRPWDK